MNRLKWASKSTPLICAVTAICVVQIFAHNIPPTGDEPEYIYYSYSFFMRHDFSMPVPTFYAAFPMFDYIPPENLQVYGHPVLLSIIASPLVGHFGISGARLVSFLCGLVGFVGIRRLLSDVVNLTASTFVALFIFVTFPVVAYLHVFYTDTASLALVAWAWRLGRSARPLHLLTGTTLSVVLPFVHIRMSLVAAGLVLLVLSSALRRDKSGAARARLIGGVLLTGAAALAAFVWHQHALFGSLVGGASTTIPFSFPGYFERLALQSLDFRHGLITYNPAMILAVAGLVVGLVYRSRPAMEAAVLLLLYTASFVWGTASESYPARFWVPAIPQLAVGMAVWLRHARGTIAHVSGGFLCLISLCNLAVHMADSQAFLTNRQASLTYDRMFELLHFWNFAGLFPWDAINYADFKVRPHMELSFPLLVAASAMTALLIAAFVVEATLSRWRFLVTLLPPAMLLVPLWFGAMRTVPASAMNLVRSEENGHGGRILITFCQPVDAILIRILARPRTLMVPPRYPEELVIEGSRNGTDFQTMQRDPTSPVLPLPRGPFRAIRLSGGETDHSSAWVRDPISVLATGGLPECTMMRSPP